jgi:hypothetical protein
MLREGHRTADIAEILRIEPYAVSKLKRVAECKGLLAPAPPIAGPNWTSDLEATARRLLEYGTHNRLRKLLDDAGRRGLLVPPLHIRVYPSLHRADREWQDRLDHFGRLSASYIRSLILSTSSVGVSWGMTLDAVVSGIEKLSPPKRDRGRGIWFLPVCGEPLGRVDDNFRSSATTLSARLAKSINGNSKHTRSLSVIPFMIPIDFEDTLTGRDSDPARLSEVQVVKKLIGKVPAHAEIFGNWAPQGTRHRSRNDTAKLRSPTRKPWIWRLSMMLTSVGTAGLPFGHGGLAYLASAGLDRDRVLEVAEADISGVLLPREPRRLNNSAEPDLLQKIESHWTGISGPALAACAKRARMAHLSGEKRKAGVVVTAIGRAKAPVILECMKRHGGLISHLVIDSDLEDHLCNLVSSKLSTATSP